MSYQILDLFAGIGGFSLAAHWMGWQTVAFVEKEPFCHKVLRKNFGEDIEIYDDIFHFDGRPFRGAVDIITGGFPCQPFSAAGKRKGRDDERHLFPQMLRVSSEVRPRWVVAENVRGLLSIESGRVFAEVVTSLESEGYEVITFCVPASALEAPHRRDRLWIVAFNADGERERAGHREVQGPDGKVSERHYDAELSDTTRQHTDFSEYAEHNGLVAGTVARGDGSANDEQSTGADSRDNPSTTRNGRGGWSEPWIEAAARLCRVDDGLPDELHITGSRDNRTSRLKALGNAVIPLIPFEIFRAIEYAESIHSNETEREEN